MKRQTGSSSHTIVHILLGWLSRATISAVLTMLSSYPVSAFQIYPEGTAIGENRLHGNKEADWWIPDAQQAHNHEIEGYAYPQSVNSSETVNVFVNTIYPRYNLRVFRLGYYNGAGARLVYQRLSESGINQPPCNTSAYTGLIDCGNWTLSSTINTTGYRSGVYIVKLDGLAASDTKLMRHFLFVVREDKRDSRFLMQVETNTIQAYNVWGYRGNDTLYGNNPDGIGLGFYEDAVPRPGSHYGMNYRTNLRPRSIVVSFKRPVASSDHSPSDQGTGEFMKNEYPFIRWAEANGFDITYNTDMDAATRPATLLNHRAVLVVGHSEYWTQEQRKNLQCARDAGVNIAFFSGNEGYWRVRNSALVEATDYSRMWCYKSATGPSPEAVSAGNSGDPLKTQPSILFRDVHQPEVSLIGVQFENGANFRGMATIQDAAIRDPSLAPMFEGTGAKAGTVIEDAYGFEADVGTAASHACNRIIATGVNSNDPSSHAATTIYRAENNAGGTVFAAGSILWGTRLDDWANPASTMGVNLAPPSLVAIAITRRILEWFSAPRDASARRGCYLPPAPVGDPTLILRDDGRREVYRFDQVGGLNIHWDTVAGDLFSNGASYAGWNGKGRLAVVVRDHGRHEFFYRLAGGGMKLTWENSSGGNFDGTQFPTWQLTGDPSVTLQVEDGRHEVFYRAPNGAMHLRWEAIAGDGFTGYRTFNWDMAGDPIAILTPDKRHEVFYRTATGALVVRWENSPGDGFSGGFTSPSNWGIVGNPAVLRNAQGRHEIYYRTTQGDLVVRWEIHAGDGYAGGRTFEHWGVAGDPQVLMGSDGRHEIFFRDGNTAQTVRAEKTPGDGYTSWVGFPDW